MHTPGALVHGDIVGQHDLRVSVDPGVSGHKPFQRTARHLLDNPALCHSCGCKRILQPIFGDDEEFTGCFDDYVGGIRMYGDSQVRRQRPRCRGPDHDERSFALQYRQALRGTRVEGKLDVDRRRCMIAVLDLGLGQGRPARGAPVNRLLSLVGRPRSEQPSQLTDDRRLVPVIHGEIGV